MTLDLLQIAPHVTAMAREVGVRWQTLERRRELARTLLHAWHDRLDELQELVRREQPWLVAEPLEDLLTTRPAPALPPDITVVATDGSSIDLDRHGLAQCYLINVGAAVIRYGAHPRAELSAAASLYYRDEDLYLDSGEGSRIPVQGALVDLKRTLAEQQRALDLAHALTGDGIPVVVVMDGTLLLWQLSGRAAEEEYVAEAIAEYAAGLDRFRQLGIPLCSLVSRPNGREVTNLLRLAACPDPPQLSPPAPLPPAGEGRSTATSPVAGERSKMVSSPAAGEGGRMASIPQLALPLWDDEDRDAAPHFPTSSPSRGEEQPVHACASYLPPSPTRGRGAGGEGPRCVRDLLESLPDRVLLDHLRPGDRSARFASRSPVLRHYGDGPEAGIEFVYLNAGAELVRLEMPAWVGADVATLDLVHAVVHDGCRRGWGYPPALAEAHEQAVIRGGDRDAFLRLVSEALNGEGRPAEVSQKQLSKNRRAV